jgi:hypothetical protein
MPQPVLPEIVLLTTFSVPPWLDVASSTLPVTVVFYSVNLPVLATEIM